MQHHDWLQDASAFLVSRNHPIGEVNALMSRLTAILDAEELGERLDAWVALVDWARSVPRSDVNRKGLLSRAAVARWSMLFDLLDARADLRTRVQRAFIDMLHESEAVNLFGSAGLPREGSFLAELSDRVLRRVLPQPADEHDLARLLHRLYPGRSEAARFVRLPPDIFARLARLIGASDDTTAWKAIGTAFADGFRLLAARVQGVGLREKLRSRSLSRSVEDSAFYRIAGASAQVLDAWSRNEGMEAAAAHWREAEIACRETMSQVERRLDADGVSVDIVFALEVLDRCLVRMSLMLNVMEARGDDRRLAAIHNLLAILIGASHDDQSVRHLTSTNMRMLQRKIVERTGKTGEHYIAWTRREYWLMCFAAAGGGLLTVVTAALKMKIVGLNVPLFIEGLLAGLNYAVSFLVLQSLGLILATKQPAMTAAALAGIMRRHSGAERLEDLVTYAVQIVRSQLGAVLGNILIASIGAYAFSALWQLLLGRPFLDHHEAEHVFDTLSPVTSLTVWYAAFTGVILWLASLIGGWFDNWAAYRRLPQAIAEHRLGRRWGRPRMVKLAGAFSRNMAGWGTNISLGLMLGLIPVIGSFFGLPMEVRHVTLNTGILSLATATMEADWYHGMFVWAIVGIGTMFVLNLGVSFLLSLYTAARAFGLPRTFLLDFARAAGRRFLQTPGKFFLPPGKHDHAPEGVGHH